MTYLKELTKVKMTKRTKRRARDLRRRDVRVILTLLHLQKRNTREGRVNHQMKIQAVMNLIVEKRNTKRNKDLIKRKKRSKARILKSLIYLN